MSRNPEYKDSEISSNLFQNGIFSRAVLDTLMDKNVADVMPSSLTLKEGIQICAYPANAAQRRFTYTQQQQELISALHNPSIATQVMYKMIHNSEAANIAHPAFKSIRRDRPRSAFVYLIRDSQDEEILLLMEGLVLNSEGVLHQELNVSQIGQLLTKQVTTRKETEIMRSGHIWGSIVLLDSIDASDVNLRAFDEKMVQVLLRHGFVVVSGNGAPISKR